MIWYSTYQLTPLKKLNAKSSASVAQGVFLKVELADGTYGYADYFPHEQFGDLSVEDIIAGKRNSYFEKCLWFAENEKHLSLKGGTCFRNHRLVFADSRSAQGTVKVKVMGEAQLPLVREILSEDVLVRLDSNGALNVGEWNDFIGTLTPVEKSKIEYIEDPGEGDWRELSVPSAKDFMTSDYFDFEIYKANAKDTKNPKKAIFSSYMGSDLGRYHCYLELINSGNLELVHGIDTPGIHKEQRELFVSTSDGLAPNAQAVEDIYRDLKAREWKCLS